jgi:hypothetical protein
MRAKWVPRSHGASLIGVMSCKVMGMYQPQLGGMGGLPGRDLGPRLPYGRLLERRADTGSLEEKRTD